MLYQMSKTNFTKSLDKHIRLLKLDYLKHQATAEVYQFYFDLAHEYWEKQEATDNPISSETDTNSMISDLYNDLEDTKGTLAAMVAKEKDLGKQNLLLGKLDQIQLLCAKISALMDKDVSRYIWF